MLNSRYDNDDDLHDSHASGPEISIGTTSIVGIFFVLALICAVFFGIGYTLGRRQGFAQGQSQAPQPAAALATSSVASKPAPGSPIGTSLEPAPSSPATRPAATTATPTVQNVSEAAPAKPASTDAPASGILVQIAALTHQEDADNEVAELHKRGYDVFARHDAGDRFIRIQIGPFANRKEAKEMCDRLLASGYNAIIK